MIYEEVPIGAKIISVFDFISAILCLYLGVLFFMKEDIVDFIFENVPTVQIFGSDFYLSGGIILCFTGLFVFLLGKGLWQGRNWARYIEIFLAVIGFIVALVLLFFGNLYSIFNLMIHGLVGGYLLYSKDVKEAFY
jgi:hypothetical protein